MNTLLTPPPETCFSHSVPICYRRYCPGPGVWALKPKKEAQLLPSGHAPHPVFPHVLLVLPSMCLNIQALLPMSPTLTVVHGTIISCLDSCSLLPGLSASALRSFLNRRARVIHGHSVPSIQWFPLSPQKKVESPGVFLSLLSWRQRASVALGGAGLQQLLLPAPLPPSTCHQLALSYGPSWPHLTLFPSQASRIFKLLRAPFKRLN